MPSKRSEFVEFIIEQMSFISGLSVRAMFSGHGVYQDDCMFALIINDQLYFKADANTRGEYEAQGLKPFTYMARGKHVSVNYFEAPPEVFDEIDAMRNWAHKALTTAMKAKKSQKSKQAN